MFASTPRRTRNGLEPRVHRLDLAPLRLDPALAEVVRVVGQAEELVAAGRGGARHLLDRRLAVGRPGRVAVHLAPQVAELDEHRQAPVPRRLELAAVLAQLRRDEAVAEEGVERLLVAERVHLARLDDGDAVLGDREPVPLRLLAQRDVVLLRAGEVLEQVAVALRRDDAEVEAEALLA